MTAKPKPFFTWRRAVLESQVSPITKLVLLTLSCHMNEMGVSCHPSIALLCRETSLSNRSVITHLKMAEALGWVTVVRAGFAGKKWMLNSYEIRWPDDVGWASFPDARGGSEPPSLPSEMAQEGSEPPSLPCKTKAVNVTTEGSERHDQMAVKEVHTSTSVSTSRVHQRSLPVDNLNATAWQMWLEYRRKIHKPLKPISIPAAQRKMAAFGSEQLAVVEYSISQGYQGLFAPKGRTANAPSGKPPPSQYCSTPGCRRPWVVNRRCRECESAFEHEQERKRQMGAQ